MQMDRTYIPFIFWTILGIFFKKYFFRDSYHWKIFLGVQKPKPERATKTNYKNTAKQ